MTLCVVYPKCVGCPGVGHGSVDADVKSVQLLPKIKAIGNTHNGIQKVCEGIRSHSTISIAIPADGL